MADLPLTFRRKVLNQVPSRDSLAHLADHFNVLVIDGRSIKAHVNALAKSSIALGAMLGRLPREDLQDICYALRIDSSGREKARLVERILASAAHASTVEDIPAAKTPDVRSEVTHKLARVFIGHGRSAIWRELKDFLQDELKLAWDEFNRESSAGKSTVSRLEEMLEQARFAFLILTAEDEHGDGKLHARENVIHEAGLFQGRLGFQRAIVLLEDGCSEFSNVVGLTQIRFPRGEIMAKSEEIRRVLKREDLI